MIKNKEILKKIPIYVTVVTVILFMCLHLNQCGIPKHTVYTETQWEETWSDGHFHSVVANSSIRCDSIDCIKLHYHLDVPLRWGRLKGWKKRQRGTSVLWQQGEILTSCGWQDAQWFHWPSYRTQSETG